MNKAQNCVLEETVTKYSVFKKSAFVGEEYFLVAVV